MAVLVIGDTLGWLQLCLNSTNHMDVNQHFSHILQNFQPTLDALPLNMVGINFILNGTFICQDIDSFFKCNYVKYCLSISLSTAYWT